MKKNLLLFYLLSIGVPAYAQHSYVNKDERYEYGAWLGTTSYSGDMDKFHYLPNVQSPGFGIGANLKYYMIPRFGVRGGIDFSSLWAADNLTNDHYKMKRDFNFRAHVTDMFITPEYTFWRSSGARIYDDYAYVYAGIGLFTYNTNLYKKDKLLSNNTGAGASFPIGMGIKFGLSYQWFLGFDIRINRTSTDELDGLSSNKYISTESGVPTAFGNSQTRIRNNSDWYYFTGVTLSYIPRRFRPLDF